MSSLSYSPSRSSEGNSSSINRLKEAVKEQKGLYSVKVLPSSFVALFNNPGLSHAHSGSSVPGANTSIVAISSCIACFKYSLSMLNIIFPHPIASFVFDMILFPSLDEEFMHYPLSATLAGALSSGSGLGASVQICSLIPSLSSTSIAPTDGGLRRITTATHGTGNSMRRFQDLKDLFASSLIQAQVFGRELVRHAKGFLDGVASVGEWVRILESELKRRETLEATLCSRVGIANLQKAQAELLLEAKHPWLTGSQSEDLSSSLLYCYPNAEGQIRCYERDFMVWELVPYPPHSSVPPSPSPLVLEPIIDPTFPLPVLADRPSAS
ncbi:hypothetical protein M9H77_07108 [Catharanthus roseus]|uniref:Uncharacterized protein n=1 Tax=Catharanthus roseus TaxID=4058 RepID=A0ACC0BU91_CATRO|nr:hypothetical protein M9H77_07108 [Catharanthus roseus]